MLGNTIRLKCQCPSCDGTGCYQAPNVDPRPCWTCHGRGWFWSEMVRPHPRWARDYDREHRHEQERST